MTRIAQDSIFISSRMGMALRKAPAPGWLTATKRIASRQHLWFSRLPTLLPLEGALRPPLRSASLVSSLARSGLRKPPTAFLLFLEIGRGVVDALVAGTEEQGVARMLVQPRWGLDLAAIARRVNGSGFEMDEAAAKVADAGAPLGPPSPRA